MTKQIYVSAAPLGDNDRRPYDMGTQRRLSDDDRRDALTGKVRFVRSARRPTHPSYDSRVEQGYFRAGSTGVTVLVAEEINALFK